MGLAHVLLRDAHLGCPVQTHPHGHPGPRCQRSLPKGRLLCCQHGRRHAVRVCLLLYCLSSSAPDQPLLGTGVVSMCSTGTQHLWCVPGRASDVRELRVSSQNLATFFELLLE